MPPVVPDRITPVPTGESFLIVQMAARFMAKKVLESSIWISPGDLAMR
jgi:hypothetical protein